MHQQLIALLLQARVFSKPAQHGRLAQTEVDVLMCTDQCTSASLRVATTAASAAAAFSPVAAGGVKNMVKGKPAQQRGHSQAHSRHG